MAHQIGQALESDGHTVEYVYKPDFSINVDLNVDGAIFVHVFDPLYVEPYVFKARSMLQRGYPVAFYTTVEGIPKLGVTQYWMVRDLRYTAVSRYVARKLAQVKADVPWIVHHGIDLEAVERAKEMAESVREMYGIPDDKVMALYVAQGHPRKGHDRFSQVLAKLAKMDDSIHAVVITDEKGMEHYSGLSNTTVLNLFGKLSEEELYAFYHAADFYVHPSLSEGFGLPVAEALAAGRLVVHPAYEPLTEITSKDTSVRVPVVGREYKVLGASAIQYELHLYDPAKFAEAMIKAKERIQEEREEIERRAKERVKHLDYRTHYKVFLTIMRQMAKDIPPAP
ncbi:MAG: glycosyltransferase [Thermococcus sp.]